jgi:hypothetical protein
LLRSREEILNHCSRVGRKTREKLIQIRGASKRRQSGEAMHGYGEKFSPCARLRLMISQVTRRVFDFAMAHPDLMRLMVWFGREQKADSPPERGAATSCRSKRSESSPQSTVNTVRKKANLTNGLRNNATMGGNCSQPTVLCRLWRWRNGEAYHTPPAVRGSSHTGTERPDGIRRSIVVRGPQWPISCSIQR